MRVVAGSAKGRRLLSPEGTSVRPTSDRVRESIYNALTSRDAVVGAKVLDAFAGSGAMGIEAWSRGAAAVTFVERDRDARACIASNLEVLGMTDVSSVQVVGTTVETFLGRVPHDAERFDLVLCDPPYDYDAWEALWDALGAWVVPGGTVVVESNREIDAPVTWEVARSKRYGGTVVTVHVRAEDPPRSTGADL